VTADRERHGHRWQLHIPCAEEPFAEAFFARAQASQAVLRGVGLGVELLAGGLPARS